MSLSQPQFVVQVPVVINGATRMPGETLTAAEVGDAARVLVDQHFLIIAAPPAPAAGEAMKEPARK